jgi:hypothetical protein
MYMTKRIPVPSGLAVTTSVSLVTALLACNAPAQSAVSSGAGATPVVQGPAAKAAAPAAAPKVIQLTKPAWLTDLSIGVKEGYDDNVFAVSGKGAPPRDSWITMVSPKIGFNFVPLLGGQKVLQVLSFGYAPDFASYNNEPTENYTAQRIATTIKGKADAFSFNLDNGFNYIDGSKTAPTYLAPDDTRSAFATGFPRERRAQFQDRAKLALQYDWSKWFVRPNASLLYYDLLTYLRSTPGYQNYADRYDVNGGVDVGYKLNPKLALTLGYRYGHQYQQQYPTNIDKLKLSSSSDYQRALVGLEGKPWPWLTVALQGGPDFRVYDPNSATHLTPLLNRFLTTYYAEASLTAEVSPKDSFIFKYRQWQWVASTGKLPYFDSLYDLSYRRKLCKSLVLDLGGRIQESDYNCGNQTTSLRDDLQYSLLAGLTWSATANVIVNCSYGVDFGRNAENNIINTAYREYNHQLGFVGVAFKL